MKQKLLHQSLIATLVTMVLLLAGSSVSAQEEYGLTIAGVKVTSENCSDLTAIPGVTGRVSYDPTTKTLTLEDASIDGGNHDGMETYDELTCVVKGEVSITSNLSALVSFKNAIIKGNGQLTIKAPKGSGIYTKAALLIEGCTVYAEGNWGIAGYDGSSGESLTIRNASVTAKGTKGSIRDLADLTLEGCEITKPAGATWNDSEHAVCDASGNVITDEVVITPTGGVTPPVEEYGLEIAGVMVNSVNCSDLTAISGVTGNVSYDPTTKTLTLEDASIDAGEDRRGICSTDELTCVVKGEVSITSNNWHAMMFYKNAIIKGTGQLTLKSREEGCGIYTEAALLIEGCTVYAEGVWGFIGNGGTSGESLTIRNASVTAKGTKGSICGLASFTLDGCEITKPAGAVWNDSKHAVCDASGNVIKDEVVITPPVPVEEYGLEIAGVQVTSENCSDLTAIPGVTGKVTYDPTTKTLTLEDASIDGGEAGIWSNDELTCVVKGEVSITSNGSWGAMAFDKNVIIKGNGQLTIKSSEKCGIITEAALLIEGCTVYAEGNWGISGSYGTIESLTIRNASVTAKGTEGSICDFTSFTLDGCSITKPAGAVWNASKHAVCDAAGNLITDQVVITPTGGVTPAVEEYGLAIASVQVTSANCSDLTAIPGVKGKVSYDPTTKTLSLEDASIDVGEGRHGISSTDELTCVVKGEVSITSNDRNAMVFGKNAIIKGNGQLTIKSSEYGGIITEAALLIEGCTVYAEGKWGIAGRNGTYGESLAIRNASVTAKGTKGSICDLTNFTLEGCSITKPAGAVWNASKHAVCDASGNVITDEVVITSTGGVTPPVEEYTVTFAADPTEGGTVTATYYDKANEMVAPFETGAKFSGDKNYLTFTAKANDGYQIVSWMANGTDVTPSNPTMYEHQLKADLDLKVVFKKVYPLTLTATKGGSLVAKVGDKVVKSGDKVAEGTKVTIEATPETGYELTALTAGTEDILATKSFVMKGATEVKATFTKLQKNYVVTLKSNDHGTITIKEKVDLKAVPEGTKLTVVAKGANDKCELTKLTANGKDILKDKTFTVTKDTEVVAVFVDHTGIDAVAANAFVIYPNPASESATVTGLAPEAAVALYTLDGQLITRLAADRSGRLQIDLTALSDGTYLVVTEGATQRLVVKH